ncbi:MAG: M23 family metallopeptidase [Candidatus Methanofastidiosia archaeon]
MKNNLVFLILGILIFRYMAVNPTLFEKEHFVNAAPGLSDTIAVYSNDIDWNNSEKYILSAAEKLDVDVKRIINPSELSEYKIILNLGGHEAYTDENMPTNISKDYLSSEDKLELKSSEFAKLVKVVEKPFWRRDQKLIIFAGNARDDTALVPQGNYDEPKSDKWDNISEVLLGTNPLITEYELLLKVFFDYNGNGEYNPDVGEHPLSDVILKVGEANCKTDEEGNCKMYAPHGRNNMEIKASKKFRYILPSVSEVIPIEDGLDILLNKDMTKNVPLAEGFLTLPFIGDFKIVDMYDHDPEEGKLFWNGNSGGETPNHAGIDYKMEIGEPILAAGPGIVQGIDEDCMLIAIEHPLNIDGRLLYTTYQHLSEILVEKGDWINRGDLIGESGTTCTPFSHLHFDLQSISDAGYPALLDPYKPIVRVPQGLWLWHYSWPQKQWTTEQHPGSNLNWWTVFNDPQNPY